MSLVFGFTNKQVASLERMKGVLCEQEEVCLSWLVFFAPSFQTSQGVQERIDMVLNVASVTWLCGLDKLKTSLKMSVVMKIAIQSQASGTWNTWVNLAFSLMNF